MLAAWTRRSVETGDALAFDVYAGSSDGEYSMGFEDVAFEEPSFEKLPFLALDSSAELSAISGSL
eukprot:CAMPEP_0197705034 /NCGR_PEP_ID=MMETSP1338-20131121/126239_1 /TAXON_ID=43686 ORGANISM="Pelagodinium beii, Strain RCC1491" /NCGR_SAMPLE_ID=MMETSP1338 /ASSEMBLY_ACC=CAM_ASM_000754 /LENGTH=64 /DNA_ID=CAMNT_0043288939 /DNA_START=993 /DNA_END=1187 /DNA_ORIENTATION=-